MKTNLLTSFLVASSLALSAFSGFANNTDSNPDVKITKIEDQKQPEGEVKTLNQFSVICLTNRASVAMNYRWWDSSAHDYFLQTGYQQTFSWNDTKAHSITVQYDSDMTGGTAWKTYRLDASPAPFPDCQFGRQYKFSNVDSRWVDIYQGLTP